MKKTRIAPTPSGFLHKGNRFNAEWISNWAKLAGASIRLRIDDIDRSRFRNAYLEDIFERLKEWDIEWQEGPRNSHEFFQSHSQHYKLERYRRALGLFGGDSYVCSCSRKDIEGADWGKGCPRNCEENNMELSVGKTALRVRIPGGLEAWTRPDGTPESIDLGIHPMHPVVWTREGFPAYHWVSILDDIDHGISDVWRGADLLESTGIQRQLARMAGLDGFETIRFGHHALITDTEGRKLSKSVLSGNQ